MLLEMQLKSTLQLWAFLLLATLPGLLCAQEQQLTIMLSSDAEYYQDTARQITTMLNNQPLSVAPNTRTLSIPEFKSSKQQTTDNDLIVAIGSEAARYASSLPGKHTTLNVLIPMAVSRDITQQQQEAGNSLSIVIDQPHTRIAELALALPLTVKAVSTVSSSPQGAFHQQLHQRLKNAGASLVHQTINDQQKPIQVLRPLFANSDVFVALPDSGVFNRAIARWVLSLSFQQKVPVIGFSQAYTDAGALVSVFSTPENIGQHAAEIIQLWHDGRALPLREDLYPKYFTIASNRVVARAMGLNTRKVDEQLLSSLLKAKEIEHE